MTPWSHFRDESSGRDASLRHAGRTRVVGEVATALGETALDGSSLVALWCSGLRAIAVLNVLLWVATGVALAPVDRLPLWQMTLSGVYVAVCAFRSWLPRIDLERFCIHDTPLSSPVVGRSLATVAEVCFGAQIALWLHQIGLEAQLPWVVAVAYLVVPPLALAQVFCWHSVLTLNHLGHAIENSLWTATMAVVGICLAAASLYIDGGQAPFVAAGAVLAFAFVVFMSWVDVPMYVARWRASRREGHRYLSLREGLRDALYRRVVTRSWSHWGPEVAWLTGYFSLAVWLSLALVHLSTR